VRLANHLTLLSFLEINDLPQPKLGGRV